MNIRVFAVSVVCAVMVPGVGWASPWVLKPDEAVFSLFSSFSQADSELLNMDSPDKQDFPLGGDLRIYELGVDLRYGLFEGIEIALRTSLKSVIFSGDEVILELPPAEEETTPPNLAYSRNIETFDSQTTGLGDVFLTALTRGSSHTLRV